jgi:hypothetical protein
MQLKTQPSVEVPAALPEAIRSFPTEREVEHCGHRFVASPFDFYVQCPHCGTRLKVRSFSAVPEIEDVFDAVFEWMTQPRAQAIAQARAAALESDPDD